MESTFKRHIVTTLVLLVLSLSAVAQSFSLSGSVVDND